MNTMIHRRTFLASLAAAPIAGCMHSGAAPSYPRIGGIERLDQRLDAVVGTDAPVEQLATGYSWAEGPVWVRDGGFLLFSDPGNNVIHCWMPGVGATPFFRPSGLTGPIPAGVREAGANGLRIDDRGRLVLADSGTRTIARLNLATREKEVLAANYQGKRFNSPNDLVLSRGGAIYFTDPPYGFSDGDRSPLREVQVNGLYRIAPSGEVALLDGSQRRPNGVALSPDERTLFLSLSDENQPQLLAYHLDERGMVMGSSLFLDMQSGFAKGLPGLPDGVKVDRAGRVFATGPGGVHVCSPQGELLGIIATGKAVSNCAFGGRDGRTLFLTSHNMLAQVRLKTAG